MGCEVDSDSFHCRGVIGGASVRAVWRVAKMAVTKPLRNNQSSRETGIATDAIYVSQIGGSFIYR